MRYLNRIIPALIVSLTWQLGICSDSQNNRTLSPVAKTVRIFGHTFTAHTNFGMGTYYDYQSGGTQTQITVIGFSSSDEAEIFMEDRLAQFRSVFEPKRVDYPGQYSKAIECSAELKPTYFERAIVDGRVAYFDGYAGSNKVAGVCSADLVRYKYMYAVAFCPKENYLLEIEHFTEMSNKVGADFIGQITCAEEAIRQAK